MRAEGLSMKLLVGDWGELSFVYLFLFCGDVALNEYVWVQ